jgi:hypothetical protein
MPQRPPRQRLSSNAIVVSCAIDDEKPTSHYFSCWSRPKFGKSIKLTFFPRTLTHPEPRLLIASHHEAIHDAGRS